MRRKGELKWKMKVFERKHLYHILIVSANVDVSVMPRPQQVRRDVVVLQVTLPLCEIAGSFVQTKRVYRGSGGHWKREEGVAMMLSKVSEGIVDRCCGPAQSSS